MGSNLRAVMHRHLCNLNTTRRHVRDFWYSKKIPGILLQSIRKGSTGINSNRSMQVTRESSVKKRNCEMVNKLPLHANKKYSIAKRKFPKTKNTCENSQRSKNIVKRHVLSLFCVPFFFFVDLFVSLSPPQVSYYSVNSFPLKRFVCLL